MALFGIAQGPTEAAQTSHALTSPPTVTASTWLPTTSHDPADNVGDLVTFGVSCATSTFCVSVGFYYNSVNGLPLIEQWNGTSWNAVTVTPALTPEFNFSLDGVSCVSATFCEAVGWYQTADGQPEVPFAVMWNGTSWSTQPVTLPAGQPGLQMNAVSCLSTTWCLATAGTNNGGELESSATSELWNGSQWTNVATAALPAVEAGDYSYLNGISCRTATFCMAVGGVANTGSGDGGALMEVWNGSAWSIAPSAPSAGFSILRSVSCAGTQFCAAVGNTYVDSSSNGDLTDASLAEMWNGSSWSVTPTPNPGGGNGDVLAGVSCFAATSCSAVGSYDTDGSGDFFQNQAAVWNGQSWTSVTTADRPVTGNPDGSLRGVDCLSNWACMATGYASSSSTEGSWNIMSPIARSGYRFVASDGGVFNYGAGAPFLGSLGGTHLNAPVVAIGIMPAGDGYYLVGADGGVFNYGSAQFYGSMGGKPLNKPIVAMAVTPDGGGYWLVASDGGVFAFGDAQFFGSAGALTLNKPVVGMASAPSGKGYWLVASDGGVFNYGPAATLWGSMGGKPLNKPIVGIGATTSGQYYLVASDGGIFAFPGGAAGPTFYGSTGAMKLNNPIVGMTVLQGGYYLSGSDGGIFAFPTGPGGLPFDGSTGGMHLNAPIVGVAN